MRIRKARVSDISRIYEIGKDEFEKTSWGNAVNKNVIRKIILEEPNHCWILEINGKVEGARFIRHEWGKVLWGWLILVSPNYRRHNYGTVLFNRTRKILKKQGYEKLFSEVAMDDIPSIKWHKKIGYKKVGVFKDWLGKGKDAIIFGIDL
jgi:ribosomal protein S18 acetylase RimI-like enzyme